jgi:hypothetical protein
MAGNALVDYAVEHALSAKASGYCPHACVIIPFGDMTDPSQMFPANEFSKLDLKLTGESGVGAVRVVTIGLRQ